METKEALIKIPACRNYEPWTKEEDSATKCCGIVCKRYENITFNFFKIARTYVAACLRNILISTRDIIGFYNKCGTNIDTSLPGEYSQRHIATANLCWSAMDQLLQSPTLKDDDGDQIISDAALTYMRKHLDPRNKIAIRLHPKDLAELFSISDNPIDIQMYIYEKYEDLIKKYDLECVFNKEELKEGNIFV